MKISTLSIVGLVVTLFLSTSCKRKEHSLSEQHLDSSSKVPKKRASQTWYLWPNHLKDSQPMADLEVDSAIVEVGQFKVLHTVYDFEIRNGRMYGYIVWQPENTQVNLQSPQQIFSSASVNADNLFSPPSPLNIFLLKNGVEVSTIYNSTLSPFPSVDSARLPIDETFSAPN